MSELLGDEEVAKILGDIVVNDESEICVIGDENGGVIKIPQQPYPSVHIASVGWSSSTIDICSRPDKDKLLRMAMDENSSEKSLQCENGSVHFCNDGSIALSCELECSNSIYILVNGGRDAIETCDIAIEKLEKMKKMLTTMQEKVFELSLSQRKVDDD